MTREEFIEAYCERSGVSWVWLSERRDAIPCDCDSGICDGWQMVPKRHPDRVWTVTDQLTGDVLGVFSTRENAQAAVRASYPSLREDRPDSRGPRQRGPAAPQVVSHIEYESWYVDDDGFLGRHRASVIPSETRTIATSRAQHGDERGAHGP